MHKSSTSPKAGARPSRRAVVAGVASLVPAAAVVVVSNVEEVVMNQLVSGVALLAGSNHPDAELLALNEQLLKLVSELECAEDDFDRIDALACESRPQMPEALRFRHIEGMTGKDIPNTDHRLFCFSGRCNTHYEDSTGQRWFHEVSVNALREERKATLDDIDDENWAPKGWPRIHEDPRAREVVAAYDAWDAVCEANKRGHGYYERQEIVDTLQERVGRMCDDIRSRSATTLEGLVAKSNVLAWRYARMGMVSEGDTYDDVVSHSIIRDLAAIGGLPSWRTVTAEDIRQSQQRDFEKKVSELSEAVAGGRPLCDTDRTWIVKLEQAIGQETLAQAA